MARRPARKSAAKAGRASADRAVPPDASTREKIIAAFMALLAEKRFEEIGLAEIAEAAGVSLVEFRGEFASPLAILAAHIKDTDRVVLAADFSDMTEEPPRERLFDVLMRRLEILAPHRDAVRSLIRSASRNPPLAIACTGRWGAASALPAYSRICSMSRHGSAGCGHAAGGGPKTIPKKPPLRNRSLLPADS